MGLSKKILNDIQQIIDTFDENNKDEIIKKITEVIMNDSPKPRTQTTRFSLIKKKFAQVTNDKEFLKKIKPDDEIIDKLIKDNKRIRDEAENINVNEDVIKKIMPLKNSRDVFDLAIWLLLMSGRRSSELMTAKFNNIRGTVDVGIDGVKKRRDGGNDCVFSPLVPKTVFFKVYNDFKRLFKFTNKDTFQRTLNRRVKKLLGEEFHPHTLRGIFALYSFKFRNKNNKKINTFIRDALCHQSINASLNYTGYKILFDNDIIKNDRKSN